MSRARIAPVVLGLVAAFLAACATEGGLGATCNTHGDCVSDLQCVRNVCIARCQRAPDCGDGYSCNSDGLCEPASGELGSTCTSEVDCAAGLACQLESTDANFDGIIVGTCRADNPSRAFGAPCTADLQCRNGTCALGRCVDLCTRRDPPFADADCVRGTECVRIPRVEAEGAMFSGCLPVRETISWDIPNAASSADVLVPVPESGRGFSLTMTVEDNAQLVGATNIRGPERMGGALLYDRSTDYYANAIRHRPSSGVSVVQVPSSTASAITEGAYRFAVSSLRPNGEPGSATPRLRAAVRLSSRTETTKPILDLHLHFVDLSDHPCKNKLPDGNLNAATFARQIAKVDPDDNDQKQFRDELTRILFDLEIKLATYDDLPAKNVRDNIAPEHVRSVLSKGKYTSGINVFFVRSLSPAGTRSVGPSPGPVGVKGTGASGIIISLEPLCYLTWKDLARTTAHQIARYLGLFPNLDAYGKADPIDDSGLTSDNLMFFSDQGGDELTSGQRNTMVASPVLR